MKKNTLKTMISTLIHLCRRFNDSFCTDFVNARYINSLIDGLCLAFDCACIDCSLNRLGRSGRFISVIVNGVTYDID